MHAFPTSPEFLAVGHVTHDRVKGEIRLGGAALYSALTACRLGKTTALLTSYGQDFLGTEALRGIATRGVMAKQTSTFRHAFEQDDRDDRVQYLLGTADTLDGHHVPSEWLQSGIVYLCPVFHEVTLGMGEFLRGALLGIAPQGWLRTCGPDGMIQAKRWEGSDALLRRAGLVIVSEKDIQGNEDLVDAYQRITPLVIVTRAEQGALVYTHDKKITVGVYPVEEQDPTGAGDCFGAAFLIRYQETGDVREAIRFATSAASFVVERKGIEGIPRREQVLSRMAEHPLTWEEQQP